MKKSIKILISFITCFILVTVINVDASTGYTYGYNGEPIYSTIGYTTTSPKKAENLGIDSKYFGSPEDLFVYKDLKTGVSTIYILDSVSNSIFVLNSNYELIDTIKSGESLTMTINNFTDTQLQAIKNNGNFLIGSNLPITIPSNMEKVNLVHDGEVSQSTKLLYELHQEYIPSGAVVEWQSSNKNVAIYEVNTAAEEVITSVGVGTTTITGRVYVLDLNEKGEEIKNVLGEVNIAVEVFSEDPGALPVKAKTNGYTLTEIRNIPSGKITVEFGTLSGIYRAVTPNIDNSDFLYISDRKNNQIYVVDVQTNEVVQVVTKPNDRSFDGKSFVPKEVVTDSAGRIYVIADNIYEGIIQFGRDGSFDRFTGVNYVQLTPWEIFWRNFSTEAQLARQTSIINTSFTGMTVDIHGFIYATSYAITNEDNVVTDDQKMIKRINPSGKDVLRRNGYQPPKGDVQYIATSTDSIIRGPSRFTGITVNDYGVYTALDKKTGRLFSYDREGNLLYISGEGYIIGESNPTQNTTMSNPVAISYLDEDIIVLDKNHKALLVYEPTDIAKLINEAVKLEAVGDYINAAKLWEEVVVQNANYEYAYIGIGKKHMANKDYQLAMKNFEDGKDRELYSRAFKMYRDAKVKQYFSPVMGTLLVVIIAGYAYKIIKKRKQLKVEETEMGDE